MSRKKHERKSDTYAMLFDAWNYKVFSLGLLLIVIGFTAMYIENEVQGFISLFVSPIMIMAGYGTVILAIMKHGRGHKGNPEQSSG